MPEEASSTSSRAPRAHRRPEQSYPPHGARQRHTPGATQRPRPPQPAGHSATSHRRPRQPLEQAHVLGPTHRPLIEHALSHIGTEQSAPPQPTAQTQRLGARHKPLPVFAEQLVGPHAGCAQLGPPHPASHVHTSGASHLPWPPQSWQRMTSHASPEYPSAHLHTCVRPSHSPWAEQLRGQPTPTEQSLPAQPLGHTQLPSAVQSPLPEQLDGQRRVVQPGPVQPGVHTHSPPCMQLPWQREWSDGSGQLHISGHSMSSHAGPPQPFAHKQWFGAAHSPRPEQWLTPEQSVRLHDSPK